MSSDFKNNPKIGYTKNMIEWRRNKVLHRLTMGWSQAEIAEELQLHPSTISLDVQYLKAQAQCDLQNHISEKLPFEYARAMEGINNVLKKTSELLDQATESRAKMECLKLQMELYRSIMSMATDGGIVERAMKLVRGMESKEKPGEDIPFEKNLQEGEVEEEEEDSIEE